MAGVVFNQIENRKCDSIIPNRSIDDSMEPKKFAKTLQHHRSESLHIYHLVSFLDDETFLDYLLESPFYK